MADKKLINSILARKETIPATSVATGSFSFSICIVLKNFVVIQVAGSVVSRLRSQNSTEGILCHHQSAKLV